MWASKPEPLDSAPLWRHVANRRLQLLRWATRCRLPRTDHPYDSCRSPAMANGIKGNRRQSPHIQRLSGSFCLIGSGIWVSVQTTAETRSSDMQGLPPMELAERFSNPDFLAKIDRLLEKLEREDD
jgi:hypothetical protein